MAVVTFSSPTLADLNGDSKLDVLVGASNGYLVALNGADGEVLWSRSVASSGINVSGCTTGVIRSSPAVGMLRPGAGGAARMAVVAGVGDNPFTASTGGVIAVDAANGSVLWTYRTSDSSNGDGCPNGVVASPTVTDVDKDGDDEVLFGAFDTLFYVLNDNGTNYPNWPQDFLDTHWSSPAVGDIDRDGQNEIVVASDEGRTTPTCPYDPGWGYNYCGGSVYAMRLDGTWLAGFPYYTWQAIQSQPALADLDGDGYLDIIFGTGAFYRADGPGYDDTFKLFAINRNGQDLNGWPVNVGGVTDGEPAVGDIDNDGRLEVVIGTSTIYCYQIGCPPGGLPSPDGGGHLAAYNHDGTLKWNIQPRATEGAGPTEAIRAPLIADYDNSGDLDVIYSLLWEVQIVDGDNGAYEIGGFGAANGLRMLTNWTILGAPAVGDINNDGQVEIVAASALSGGGTGAVYAWRPSGVPAGAPTQPWPMFRRNAAHTGRYAPPFMQGGPTAIVQLHPLGSLRTYTYIYNIQNLGDEAMTFTTSDTSPQISVQPASTSIGAGQSKTMTVTLSGFQSLGLGTQTIGTITIQATYAGGTHAINSPRVVTVTAIVANTIYDVFLPVTMKASGP